MNKSQSTSAPQPPRRLPIVTINSKAYFADERLQEYRAVDNPHDAIPMGEVIVILDKPAGQP